MISRCFFFIAVIVSSSSSVFADEGMWLFNSPPRKQLKEKYQFEPTPQWLEHLQKSSVRFNSGGSGSHTFNSAGTFSYICTIHPNMKGTVRVLSSGGGGGTEAVQDLKYAYDPAGNITFIRDEAQQSIFFRNKKVEPNNDYTYDPIYRLVRAKGREHLVLLWLRDVEYGGARHGEAP